MRLNRKVPFVFMAACLFLLMAVSSALGKDDNILGASFPLAAFLL